MAGKLLDYNQMVETALRGAVREALKRVAEFGLPGNHHFYITFRTDQPGVELPEYLHERYPEEMTIVLQHQYWGLEANEDWFQVTLSFNKVPERLVIAYAAITAFADPSVQFGLQFRVAPNAENRPAMATPAPIGNAESATASDDAAAGEEPAERKTGDVVALDAFRKKKP
ncbi:MAG: ClpXP protease specificity-enhancing factor SspB [Ferrovibrio sp.]|uniref:SspB family protein n=1 Tax=Ferrovibrio sp. TaxID=1917215 RepID=UPI002639FC5B|nr:ClpXP protease specificity-enhancing factor SspB [Ferrovibrio sp.]MCW0235916.1 ClpXP protease specificity-enhancing factor SspB [Ferrovibrio sp.]